MAENKKQKQGQVIHRKDTGWDYLYACWDKKAGYLNANNKLYRVLGNGEEAIFVEQTEAGYESMSFGFK